MSFLKKIIGSVPGVKFISRRIRSIGREIRRWLLPGIPAKDGFKIQRQGSDFWIPVQYGRGDLMGIVVDKNVTGANKRYMHMLVVFCMGEIEEFERFEIDGTDWNDEKFNKPGGGKWFTYELRTGSSTQNPVNAVGKLNRFDATNSHYRDIAHAFFTFEVDKEQTIWRGEPQIKAFVKGKKVLDPRTSTVAYSETGALHLLDYVKSPIYGFDMLDEDIDLDSFKAVASISEITTGGNTVGRQICEWVPDDDPHAPPIYMCRVESTTTESFARFTNNTIIDTEQKFFDNMQELANSYRGFFPNLGGQLAIASETEGAPVFGFNASNIVSDITGSLPDIEERFNQVTVRFRNVENDYAMDEVVYPETGSQLHTDSLAEDGGQVLDTTIEAPHTIYKAEALQTAMLAFNVSRNSETANFTGDFTTIEVDVGDIVTVTDDVRGWSLRQFRIASAKIRTDGLVDFTLVQHDDGLYPWSAVDYKEIIGGSNFGEPGKPRSPAGLSFAQDTTLATTGTLTWGNLSSAFIRSYRIVVLDDNSEEVINQKNEQNPRFVIPLLPVGNYTIEVYAATSLGIESLPATLSLTLALPVAPTALGLTSSNTTVTSEPVLASAGIGTEFHFDIDDLSDGSYTPTPRMRGASAVFTGKLPNTEHRVWARSSNAYGESDWVSDNVKTTNNAAELPPAFIGELESELEELEGKFPVKTVDISDDAVTAPKILASSVTAEKIAADAVTTNKLAAGAVTANKISVDRLSALTANMGVLNAGTINVGGGDDYVIINDTQSYIDVGGRDGRVFRISKDGDSYINGHALGAASVMGESLSQDAIDFIIAAIGAATPDSGGVRSMTFVPSTTTRTLESFTSNGSAVQLRVAYGGQSSGRILCGQGQQPPTPSTPSINITVRRGTTVLFNQVHYGSVTLGEVVSQYCRDIQVEMPGIDINFTDDTPPQGDISYNVVMVVSWPSEFGSLHTRLDFRSSQNAVAGGGVSTWAQLSGKPFETVGAGLEVAADALRVKYGATAGTAAQGNDARITGAAQKAANLSDLSSASAARQNLGLGTAATRNVGLSAGAVMEQGSDRGLFRKESSNRVDYYSISTDPQGNAWNAPHVYSASYHSNNNMLAFFVGGLQNQRRVGIQSGHASTSYASAVGTLDLNPMGGTVTVGKNAVLHSGSGNQTKAGTITAHDFILS